MRFLDNTSLVRTYVRMQGCMYISSTITREMHRWIREIKWREKVKKETETIIPF